MIDPAVLEAVEEDVTAALRTGSDDHLDIAGYGEISTVIRIETGGGVFAAKRLPAMTREQFEAYRATVARYLDELAASKVHVAETEVLGVGVNAVVPYCVQPLEPLLLVDELRDVGVEQASRRMQTLVEAVTAVVGERTGLDAQVSNWAVRDGGLVYFDVTTPFLRDDRGGEMLDTDVFIAALPWAARAGVKRFLLDSILEDYYDVRAVVLNAAGNLYKERLAHVVEPLLAAANPRVTPAITPTDAQRYYRTDARVWGLLQLLRRADRSWQRTVRRRPYPFLLPGPIER